MYQVVALIVLTLFTWVVAMWASCDGEDDGEGHHDVEKSDTSVDEYRHRDVA